jgi:hypothetical protein
MVVVYRTNENGDLVDQETGKIVRDPRLLRFHSVAKNVRNDCDPETDTAEKTQPLSFGGKIQNLGGSLSNFISSGFQTADPETFNARLETCRGCEFWDESGFVNTGRCQKCGCSTQAKLRMATEKCPISKW